MSQALFGRSLVRRRILTEFFTRPRLQSHVRETARRIDAGVSAVGRELNRLEGEGILESNVVGRNRIYRLGRGPIAASARDLFQKTVGAGAGSEAAREAALGRQVQAVHPGRPLTLEALRRRKAELEAIARRRGASNIRVFGSVAKGTAGDQSDVDLIVDMNPESSGLAFVGLMLDLEEALGCPVHLVETTPPREPVLDRVLSEAVPL